MKSFIFATLGASGLMALLSGCGSSGGGGGGNSTEAPPVTVSVSEGSVAVPMNGAQLFTAAVQNDPSNRGVVWSVQGTGCGGGPCGKLQDPMANQVVYIAPDHVPNPATEMVTATAVADNRVSATATVNIVAIAVLNVNPASITIALGDTRLFTATTNSGGNVDPSIAWSITGCPSGVDCGSFSPATTTSFGQATSYTAPASVPGDIQVSVTATAVADPAQFATAALTISTKAKPISVAISPTAVNVPIGEGTPFTATVNNGSIDAGVSWTISGCASGPCGSITNGLTAATYAAPITPQSAQPGTEVTIIATSNEDRTKSGSALVTLMPAAVNFSRQTIAAGKAPDAVVTADFDNDGKLDVAVAGKGNPGTPDLGDVSLLLGNGDGTFQAAVHFPAGRNPISLATGDLNNDGRKDLVVTDFGDRPTGGPGEVNVLLGNGDGSFQTPVSFAAGSLPFTLALGDFNGDLKLDVAVSDFHNASANDSGGINLLLGNGDGTLQAPILLGGGQNPVGVVAHDFNGDGMQDLAVADQHDPSSTTRGGVTILLGKGDSTFQSPASFGVVDFPTSIAVADLNRDGKADLIVTSFISAFGRAAGPLILVPGNGDGSFSPPVSIGGASAFPLSPAVADFDGDNRMDVAEILGSSVSVFREVAGRPIWSRLVFFAGASNFALATADFNADGKPDIVVANMGGDDVSILMNISGQ